MTKRQDVLAGVNDSVNVTPDNMNRVSVWENTTANDAPFARSRYTYDNLSRERSVSRDEEGGYRDSFGYNDRNQLTSASYSVAVATPTPTPTPTPPPPTPTPTPPPPTPTPTPPPGKVLPVNFNPNSFTNRASPPSPLTVYLGTQTAGAVIYYTHNGTTPVPGNGTTFKYSGSVTVPAGDDWFLKAMATKSGMINSDVTTSGEYNNTDPITAPAGAPPPGGNAAAFTAPASRTVSYAFTAADPLNRDSVTENGVLTNYTANKLNQYSNVGGQGMSYDNNFNLTGDGTHTYKFDAQNELVGVDGVTVQLVYDGLGRVLKRTINNNATIFVYDGWKVIEELNNSGTRVAYNVYGAGPDEILLRNQNGATLIYHTDKEGNVMFLLDAAGNGIERYTYDAFGAAKIMDWSGNLRGGSAYGNRYMFNGKDYVAEMGLYDYRHRWYQPQLGRFLQVDPKGFDAGDENLFRYCLDDPVDRTDPEGLWGWSQPVQSYSGMVEINSGYSDGITGTNGARMAASGSDLANQYGPTNVIFAQVNRGVAQKNGTSGKNFEQRAHESAVKMLAEETHDPDVTKTGLITNGPPGRIGPVKETIVHENPMDLESKRVAREVIPLPRKGQEAIMVHYHHRTGRDGVFSTVDGAAVQHGEMYFTNRESALMGRYYIYPQGQTKPGVYYDDRIKPDYR